MPPRVLDLLRERYWAAYERLVREERFAEAAFVPIDLLREASKSIGLLEEHGFHAKAGRVSKSNNRALRPSNSGSSTKTNNGRTISPALQGLLERTSDRVLRADLPTNRNRSNKTKRDQPLRFNGQLAGLLAVLDAVLLHDGRLLVALGVRGGAILRQNSSTQVCWSDPVDAFVTTPSTEHALAVRRFTRHADVAGVIMRARTLNRSASSRCGPRPADGRNRLVCDGVLRGRDRNRPQSCKCESDVARDDGPRLAPLRIRVRAA